MFAGGSIDPAKTSFRARWPQQDSWFVVTGAKSVDTLNRTAEIGFLYSCAHLGTKDHKYATCGPFYLAEEDESDAIIGIKSSAFHASSRI
jgi:hypothetical protein